MAVLSDFIKGGSSVAQTSLTASVYKSPPIPYNVWTSMLFNTIDVNQNTIITSINPSTSSIGLKSGIYQASFYHALVIDASSKVTMGKRIFNITTNTEITRFPQVVYNNLNSPLYPTEYFTSNITFNLASDSTIALQFFNTRSSGTVELHYTDSLVTGATVIDGINRGYVLNLYKLD